MGITKAKRDAILAGRRERLKEQKESGEEPVVERKRREISRSQWLLEAEMAAQSHRNNPGVFPQDR